MQSHSRPDVLIQQARSGLELGSQVRGRSYRSNDEDEGGDNNSHRLLGDGLRAFP